MITLPLATELLQINKVTAQRTIQALVEISLLQEITGKSRDRIYAYRKYLDVMAEGTFQ